MPVVVFVWRGCNQTSVQEEATLPPPVSCPLFPLYAYEGSFPSPSPATVPPAPSLSFPFPFFPMSLLPLPL